MSEGFWGQNILWSNSTLGTVRACEQKFAYRFVDGLTSSGSYAMERGSWFHHCLAAHHIAKGMREGTLLEVPTEIDLRVPGIEPVGIMDDDEVWLLEFTRLLEDGPNIRTYPLSAAGMLALLEEQVLGTLPEEITEDTDIVTEVRNLLERYLYHYREDDYEVLLVEHRWRRQSEEGIWFDGAVDLVKRSANGLVSVVDHKTHANTPDAIYRLTNAQLHLYAWGIAPLLASHDVVADAVEYDYIVTTPPVQVKWTQPKKAPKKPTKTNPEGKPTPSRLYKDVLDSKNMDILTLNRAIAAKKAEIEAMEGVEDWEKLVDWESVEEYRQKIAAIDHHPFFQREVMPLHEGVQHTLLTEHHITVERGLDLLSGRLPTRSTDWFKCRQCEFSDLCVTRLYNNDDTALLAGFTKQDNLTMVEEATP